MLILLSYSATVPVKRLCHVCVKNNKRGKVRKILFWFFLEASLLGEENSRRLVYTPGPHC